MSPRHYLYRVLSLFLLCILSPALLVIAGLLFFSTGESPLYIAPRLGFQEKSFRLFKFRSMRSRQATSGKQLIEMERITTFGHWLRRYALDELPQLWNVVKGDMSWVGPRPLLPEYLPLYSNAQRQRHKVLPGLTGWAQIHGRNRISWQQKFALDLEYVQKHSWKLDLVILIKTVQYVLSRPSDANASTEMTMPPFNGHN